MYPPLITPFRARSAGARVLHVAHIIIMYDATHYYAHMDTEEDQARLENTLQIRCMAMANHAASSMTYYPG